MSISSKALNALRQGRIVGAELAAPRPDFRAFVLVIPQVPDPYKNPDAWIHWGHRPFRNEGGVINLKDPSLITGYEIRYLEHHAKYTDEEWGMDYDYVLDDTTTRIKRIYIKRVDEIENSLEPWLKDLSRLEDPHNFDSSLVNSFIDYYLDRPDERPHLWL
jgi:hypothetical protein